MKSLDAKAYWDEKGAEYFRELSTFGAIADEVVLKLLTQGRVVQLDAGEMLYAIGERSDTFYVVLSGTVNTYMPRADGGLSLARSHEAGDDMGFVPMIALCARPATTIADTDSVVLEISSDLFFQLHQQEPDAFGLMMLNLVRGMARAVINLAEMVADLDNELNATTGSSSAPSRMEPGQAWSKIRSNLDT